MGKDRLFPDYIFESSWEVCNKVGGIYTVLSTRAKTLTEKLQDRLIFIGPDCWGDKVNPYFSEDESLYAQWKTEALKEGLKIKIGRWNIPGEPVAILIDFNPYFAIKDQLYGQLWNDYQVDSLHAYGDYDEASMFSYAAALVVESFYKHLIGKGKKVIYHGNEWMTGLGVLYVNKHLPEVATIFTTHATSIGRSIAGNNKPLYDYLFAYNGDQMAGELNMQSKHSIEKQTAMYVDCFTTVSDSTAPECKQLLDKEPDIVTPNGFEPNFVPEGKAYDKKRAAARATLLKVAEKLTGCKIDKNALLVSTSGRYEYRNKGIDVFIEAMNRVRTSGSLQRELVAFIMVPAWTRAPRADLKEVVEKNIPTEAPLQLPFITHWLNNMAEDRVLNYIQSAGFSNSASEKLKIIFVPCYLDGKDGIFNQPYYDMLIGMDATVYPSYYEPWGYTPLESVAFGIPTITTNLAGFGLWARKSLSDNDIREGVVVVDRDDFNYFEVADSIMQSVLALSKLTDKEVKQVKANCFDLARKAEWSKFIRYYEEAFAIALEHAAQRNQ